MTSLNACAPVPKDWLDLKIRAFGAIGSGRNPAKTGECFLRLHQGHISPLAPSSIKSQTEGQVASRCSARSFADSVAVAVVIASVIPIPHSYRNQPEKCQIIQTTTSSKTSTPVTLPELLGFPKTGPAMSAPRTAWAENQGPLSL